MKKTRLTLIFILMLLCVGLEFSLTACGDDEHIHTPNSAVREKEVSSTCTAVGSYDEVIYCSECNEEISRTTKTTEMLSHTPSDWITDTEATCKVEGQKHKECTVCHTKLGTSKIDKLTTHTPADAVRENEVNSKCDAAGSYDEVVYCSVCNIELSREEKEIAKLPHTEATDIAKAPTCTETGLTEGKHCSVCNEVLIAQETVKANGHADDNNDYTCDICKADLCTEHKEEIIPAVSATCTEPGLTEGKKCSICGDILVAQESVGSLGHTEVIDKSVNATETNDGLTEGKHCSVCGETILAQQVIPANLQGTDIKLETLTVVGDKIYGSVTNSTTYFSFINDVLINFNANFEVSKDVEFENRVESKIVSLLPGDNNFFILVTNGNLQKLYTVSIYRNKMCNVTFSVDGGTPVQDLSVEEGQFIQEPTTSKEGYLFEGWDYDFDLPITDNTVITALWTPKNDTKYIVQYYKENQSKTGYDLIESKEFVGTTDSTVTADDITYDNFKLNTEKGCHSGILSGDGKLVLSLYYDRNVYTVSISDSSFENKVTLTGAGSYIYGDEVYLSVENIFLGYEFVGWYDGDTLLSNSPSYNAIIESDIIAKVRIRPEISNFIFSSSVTLCMIEGVKDSSVTEISIPEYVTSITLGAFKGCQSLKEIELYFTGYSETSSNKHFGYAFGAGSSTKEQQGAYIPASLKTVVLKGKGAINDYAFYGCSGITDIQFSSDSNYTSIGQYAFYGCSGITNVDFIPSGITSIGKYAFANCDGIKTFTIPDSVNTISSHAFYECNNLANIIVGTGVTSIGISAFKNCTSLQSITLPFVGANKDATGYQSHFGYIFGYSSTYLSGEFYHYKSDIEEYYTYYIPDSLTTVILDSCNYAICENAFFNCTSITDVIIENSITSIGAYAFYQCSNLANVSICDSVTSIGAYAFYYCSSLINASLGNGITNIGKNAFELCTSLTSINIPASVIYIGESAFNRCNVLNNVYITDLTAWCNISFSLRSNPLRYAENLYLNENLITALVIPDEITKILPYTFNGYSSLISVTIHDDVTTIGGDAFSGCSSLKNVSIPNSVTYIGDSAFSSCSNLESVIIGNRVIGIGSYAFYQCCNIKNIYYRGTNSQWDAISKGLYWDQYFSYSSYYVIAYTITYNYTGH